MKLFRRLALWFVICAVCGASPAEHSLKTFQFDGAEVKDVVRKIADDFNLQIVIPDELSGKVTLNLKDVTWEQALLMILLPHEYYPDKSNDIVFIRKLRAAESSVGDSSAKPDAEFAELVTKQAVEGFAALLKNPDYADAMAEFTWNYFQALKRKGFSAEEALAIVKSGGALSD